MIMKILKIGGRKMRFGNRTYGTGDGWNGFGGFYRLPCGHPMPYKISPTSVHHGLDSVTDSSFNCGGLSFSNFTEIDAGGAIIPTPGLATSTWSRQASTAEP